LAGRWVVLGGKPHPDVITADQNVARALRT
jgi:hypothetical protein